MTSSRSAITAHPQRRELLGALLEARRRNLGYATRASFERERQVQGWLIVAIERASQRSIDPGRLRFLARAYGFTYESALAVLNGEADELVFVPPGPVPPLPAPAPKRKRKRKQRAAGTAVPSGLRPIEGAPPEGRRLLGVLLAQRRAELGYTHWPAFARDKLPLTEKGNPNTRLLADIEKAYRENFPEPRLRQLARAYGVAYESLTDVAHLRARALVPAAAEPGTPPPPAVPGEPPGWTPPAGGAAYSADVRRRTDRIWERLRQLALRGVADPDGTQVFLRAAGDPPGYAGIGSPADARDWDGAGSRLDLPDRVWLIADLQRGDAARAAGSRSGASGALARRDARDAIA